MTFEKKQDLIPANIGGMRRSKLRIVADILKHAQAPTKKTHIMYECNLSFDQLKRYLALLKNRALIRRKTDSGSVVYQTTRDGHDFLKEYSRITRLLQSPEPNPF